MEENKFFEGIMASLMVCMIVLFITIAAFLSWRPKVTKWESARSRYSSWTTEFPKRIKWYGVEYECRLIEEDEQ